MVSANNKRREKDVMKLLVSSYDVTLTNESCNSEFIVKFLGPKESHYEGVSIDEDFKILPSLYDRGVKREYSIILVYNQIFSYSLKITDNLP